MFAELVVVYGWDCDNYLLFSCGDVNDVARRRCF